MRVKIDSYCQVKGKGAYILNGELVPFTYTQFRDEQMIPPGEYADLNNSILSPLSLPWYFKLWLKIKEVLKWR